MTGSVQTEPEIGQAEFKRVVDTLAVIARGGLTGGRLISGENARQLARKTLVDLGRKW